ncbi:hypothetical protein V495_02705 [Pseudogymnoascus sp. VKM F-4514 (FW-929)]|nr:hypothetical protein V495_02705 [Pseudogymnoascus sp. VKM F-4514 (FW-929)]KFY56439.1 hypothetical protein V497_06256 [Pseudogymnoascus sp. VKM F-4516 (FW-969)]
MEADAVGDRTLGRVPRPRPGPAVHGGGDVDDLAVLHFALKEGVLGGLAHVFGGDCDGGCKREEGKEEEGERSG